jgi:excisionase family DNA binding protein
MRNDAHTSGPVDVVRIDPSVCATVSLAEAATVLGVHRSTAWELYRRGEFPVPVLQIGRRLRVSKVHLERLLCGSTTAEGPAA